MQRKASRREFIKVGAASTGGLLVSFYLPGCQNRTLTQVPSPSFSFNAYIEIDTQGITKITVPVPEIGQGVRTALPMLVAEELEADWSKVRVEQADAGEQYGGRNQRAAGSNSIAVYWEPLRHAGAVTREILLQAAAQAWGVEKHTCRATQGYVIHQPTGRSLGFGVLAEKAATLPVPKEVSLKDPGTFNLIGKAMPNIDTPQIVNGSVQFGMDVKVPGMLYAVIERCPTYGGRVVKFDDTKTRQIPGVRYVIKVDQYGAPTHPTLQEGIAVVATNTWAALQGRKALSIEWDEGPNNEESTEHLHSICQSLTAKPAKEVRNDGDIDKALTESIIQLDELYQVPFITHVPMEPMNCVADVKEGQIELWVPTQMPVILQRIIASIAELPQDAITLHVTRIGGAFGRRLAVDFALEAIHVSKAVSAPVKVIWTREDDIQQSFYRPFSYHRMKAGLNAEGKLVAWLHRQAGTSRYAFRPNEEPANSEFFINDFPANLIPNFRLEYALAPSNIRRGLIRAPGHNALAFVKESFVDEVANSAGVDPLAFRLSLLGEARSFIYGKEDGEIEYIDTGRMRNVLVLAAQHARWGTPLPTGWGRGIATYYTFKSYVAHVAEVSVNASTGIVKVHRFFSAVDCGTVVNPSGLKAQVEGGIIDGLSAALYGEITINQGRTEQSNFHNYPLLRIKEAPEIVVQIVSSTALPTGMSEAPYPPVAPALCNAIFAATGNRIRRLPIRTKDLRT